MTGAIGACGAEGATGVCGAAGACGATDACGAFGATSANGASHGTMSESQKKTVLGGAFFFSDVFWPLAFFSRRHRHVPFSPKFSAAGARFFFLGRRRVFILGRFLRFRRFFLTPCCTYFAYWAEGRRIV